MSDPLLDALAETARNRGLKLVRSRVRTPGKRRFGKAGLTDASGKAVFGMDEKGPTAKPEQVEEYLRGLSASDWGASLDAADPPRKHLKRKPGSEANTAANDPPPSKMKVAARPKAKPKARPLLSIRAAKPSDAPALIELMKLLGHEVTAPAVRKRISALEKAGIPQLVAALDKRVIGLVGIHRMEAVHRQQPVGRITILVVAEDVRGAGTGRRLLEAAEEQLRKQGCGIVEVTSNDRLGEAHAFYRHMGYERTSIRFAKTLDTG